MSVKLLIKEKGSFVPVIKSERTLNDVINQLDLDNVGGLVVTDDNHKILGIITTSLGDLKTMDATSWTGLYGI